MLNKYEQTLLQGWEEVHKRGQLTLWILLALKNGPKHMAEIKNFIHEITEGSLSADDKSMYRSLRRFYDAQLVDFKMVPGSGGPELKIYNLTPAGERVLSEFVNTNITNVFYKPTVRALLTKE